MRHRLTDEMFDARLMAYLDDRAEDGAARARTPEQLAVEIATRLRPASRMGLEATRFVRLAWLVGVALLLLALLTAVLAGGRWLSVAPTKVVKIAIELPLGGNEPAAASIVNGIMLAVKDTRGRAGHFQVEIPRTAVLSDVVDGLPDPRLGAANMRQIAADPDVVAVIGPFNSSVAQQQIPISKAAGMLQCSPANTEPQLTQTAGSGIQPSGSPAAGRANYVRVVTTDDVAAAGAARYLFERLGKTSVYVVDDNGDYGKSMTNWFAAEFTRLGGSVVSRASLPDSGSALSAMLVAVRAKKPQAIYFGGTADRGATLLRAVATAGLADIPFVGTDALNDGGATASGSFLSVVGDGARSAYSVFPGLVGGPRNAAFEAGYRAEYGVDPTAFAAAGYACAQVVMAALQHVDANPPANASGLRDAVRAAGVDTGATFDTTLGPLAFDARGDVTRRAVAIYRYDAATGRWVYADEIEAAAGFGR
jgi:branched-chain amino acid transport system substrate-binding protein